MIDERSVSFRGPVEEGTSRHDLFPQPTAFVEDCINGLFLYEHGADEDIVGPLEIAITQLANIEIYQTDIPVVGKDCPYSQQSQRRECSLLGYVF